MRFVSCLLVTLIVSPCLAATIHVPSEQPTIQAGIDAAVDGDTVLVAAGSYTETLVLPPLLITVVSEQGADSTILTHTGTDSAHVLIDGSTVGSALKGFTFVGSVVYSNDIVETEGTIPWFEISENKFLSTGAENAIDADGGGTFSVKRNLFVNIRLNPIVTVDPNCEFINNTVVDCYRGLAIYGENSEIINNIVVGSSAYGIYGPHESSTVDYNNIWGNGSHNDPGPNGISTDPLFVNPPMGDYSLRDHSPCVDAGSPEPAYKDPDGTRNDIGAYYVHLDPPAPYNINYGTESTGDTAHSLQPVIFWSYLDTSQTTQSQYEIQVGNDEDWSTAEMWETGEVSSTDTSVTYAGVPLLTHSLYFVRVRISNGVSWGGWRSRRLYTRPYVIHVPAELSTIQSAIDVSIDGDTILVGRAG